MQSPLPYWKLKENLIVRTGSQAQLLVRLLKQTSGRWDYVTLKGKAGTSKEFFPATEADIKQFLLENTQKDTPRKIDFTNPEETIARYRSELELINGKMFMVMQYLEARDERLREAKRKASQQSLNEREQEARELFESLQPGDLVRVVGVRDARYKYRLVGEIIGDSFKGFQYRKTREGKFARGGQYTQHLATKIREVLPKGQWDAQS